MAEAAAKWEGKISIKVKGTADQIWPLLADFCNIGKWAPGISACYKVEGEDGQPGVVRYCNFGTPEAPQFAHEKLLSIDHDDRFFSYTITENNCGIKGHYASWKVIPIHGDAENGSEIEWAFDLDPIDGMSYEGYVGFCQSSLQALKESFDKL